MHYGAFGLLGAALSDVELDKNKSLSIMFAYFALLLKDCFFNPFHVLENRNILQSGITEFKGKYDNI